MSNPFPIGFRLLFLVDQFIKVLTDLLELFAYSKELRHGKGAWTFAKLTELRAKSQSLGPNK